MIKIFISISQCRTSFQIYPDRNQYFNREETTYQIVYHCVTYQANNSVNYFLQGINETDFVSSANKLPGTAVVYQYLAHYAHLVSY